MMNMIMRRRSFFAIWWSGLASLSSAMRSLFSVTIRMKHWMKEYRDANVPYSLVILGVKKRTPDTMI